MTIRVVCPQCAKVLQAPDAAAGKRARCAACQTPLVVPVPAPAQPVAAKPAAASPIAKPAPVAKPAAIVKPSPAVKPAPLDDDEYRVATVGPVSRAAPAAPRPMGAAVPQPARPQPLPAGSPAAASPRIETPRPAAAAAGKPNVRGASSVGRPWWREYAYVLFAAALLPLVLSTVWAADDLSARIERTAEANPEAFNEIEDLASLCAKLPDGRFLGAHLPRDTWLHWFYAAISAGAFLGLVLLAFDHRQANPLTVALVALGTATAGIFLLICMQYLAEATQGVWIRGRGWGILVFFVMKLIGFSYHAAEDPENGFLLSFFGFTVGVGLCEELVKALPVVLRARSGSKFTWRAAVMWGLASGIGFGVGEGIMYSSRYYNGLQGGEIYVVRFVSCVALHAVWTAAVSMLIWKSQEEFQTENGWGEVIGALVIAQGVPMVLHGLYDTMLKRDMQVWALAVAAASFVWLAYLVETVRRDEQDAPVPQRPALRSVRA